MLELSHLDWLEVLKHIQDNATSGSARLTIQNTQALSSPDQAELQFQRILDSHALLMTGTRPSMQSLDLFEPWFIRIKRNATLKALEIRDVRAFCLEAIALREVALPIQNDWCDFIKKNLMDASEPLSAIDQILTPRGEIRSDASETLYRLTKEKETLTRQVAQSLDKLVNDHQMSNYLQDKYVTTRDGRWVLPIRSGSQHSVKGVIHGLSQTKQTVFTEPEVVIPLNNRLRQIEVEIEDEIERLLTELSKYLGSRQTEFSQARDLLAEVDTLLAKAQWSSQIQAHPIHFSENEIFLVDVKHPLMQFNGKNPIANTVQLGEKKCVLLLSGPNAGGKTVLLKSIGLAAQMSRCGLPVCASPGSRLPFFSKIQVGIGDSQNVEEELSTFAAHLKVLEGASQLKGLNNLILIDEICGSTDPEEGSALARSFIERFAHNQVFAIITSHLGPLKSGWQEEDRVLNGSLEYDSKTGRPTYSFLPGIPGDSLAIQTAKRVGVTPSIIQRALELLSPVTRTRLAGLEELEQLKSDINSLREQLRKDQNRAKAEQSKFEKLTAQLEKEKTDILERVRREAEKKIEELIQQSKVEQTFKRHSALSEIKSQMPEIVKSRPGNGPANISTAEEFAEKFPPGSKVFVPSLGQDGIVQSTPNAKGEVLVLSGSLRLGLLWSDLKPASQSTGATAQILRKSTNISVALQDQDKTVDLRGKTVEEALSELEMALDNAATQKQDRVKIIHGHGTEALKKSVRAYLSRSIYVKKWKAGSPEQGGDGVTWAELSDD